MVAGTDGTDYSHRERVASQYSVSATNKARLRFLVVLHLLLGVLHNVRLAPFLLAVFGLSFPALPLLSSLPPPLSTEYLWLASLPATFMALSACKRSRARPLQVFQAVILLCCVSSSLLTLAILLPDTLQFILEGRSDCTFSTILYFTVQVLETQKPRMKYLECLLPLCGVCFYCSI